MSRRPGSRTRSISLNNMTPLPSYGGPTRRPRRVSLPLVKAEPTEVNSNGTGREEYGRGKVLLRDWLLLQANENRIPGLRWIMEDGERYLKIPWIHGSKASWTIEDCKVFESWAKYTGKFWSSPRNPKKWKANFRCAINSLPDVEEMKAMGCKSGTKAFKVYKFLPEQPRKHRVDAELKRRTIIPSTHSVNSPSSSPISCTSKSLEVSTEIKTEDSAEDEVRSNHDSILLFRRLSSSIDEVSSSSSSSSSSMRLRRRRATTISPSSKTNPKDVGCPQDSSPSLQRSPGLLLPLYVTQMSVDDDNDDDDDSDEESNHLPCIVENEAGSSEGDDNDDNDNDDDDDDDKGSRHTFLEFCDRREDHSPRKVFSRISSTSVSESWFPNINQYCPVITAAPNRASSSGLTSHAIETDMVETTTMTTTTLDSFIPTSSVSSALTVVSLDSGLPLHLSTVLESGIELLGMPEIPEFDLADMLDVDWL